MKKTILLFGIALAMFIFAGCKDEGKIPLIEDPPYGLPELTLNFIGYNYCFDEDGDENLGAIFTIEGEESNNMYICYNDSEMNQCIKNATTDLLSGAHPIIPPVKKVLNITLETIGYNSIFCIQNNQQIGFGYPLDELIEVVPMYYGILY